MNEMLSYLNRINTAQLPLQTIASPSKVHIINLDFIDEIRIIPAHFHLLITPSGLVFWQGSVDAQRQRCHESRVQWQPHRVGLSKTRRFTSKGRLMLLRECAKSNVKTEEMFKKARFHRRFSYKTTPPYAPRFTRLRTLAKLSPMIVEILL